VDPYTAPDRFRGDLHQIGNTLDAQRGDVRRLVSGFSEVFAAAGSRSGALQGAVTAGSRVLDTTARRDQELAATIRALPPFLAQLRATTSDVGAAGPDVQRAASRCAASRRRWAPALRSLETSAPEFRKDLPCPSRRHP